jgi:hypothetical protein
MGKVPQPCRCLTRSGVPLIAARRVERCSVASVRAFQCRPPNHEVGSRSGRPRAVLHRGETLFLLVEAEQLLVPVQTLSAAYHGGWPAKSANSGHRQYSWATDCDRSACVARGHGLPCGASDAGIRCRSSSSQRGGAAAIELSSSPTDIGGTCYHEGLVAQQSGGAPPVGDTRPAVRDGVAPTWHRRERRSTRLGFGGKTIVGRNFRREILKTCEAVTRARGCGFAAIATGSPGTATP